MVFFNKGRGVRLLLGSGTAFLVFLSSCGPSDSGNAPSLPKQIIGQNDLIPIDSRYLNSHIVRAIGQMAGGCTVSHLGNGIAMTAGHCFANQLSEGHLSQTDCSADVYQVTWGLTYGSEGLLTSHCQEIIAGEFNGERDYAIFRVLPQPEDALEIVDVTPSVGARINILSHPRKRPLEWSGYCFLEGYFPKSNYNKVGYQCDTEGGSSGAAILNDSFQVIGVHNFYDNEYGRNGGTLIAATPLPAILSEQ